MNTPDGGTGGDHRRFAELFTAHSIELTGFAVRRVGVSAAGDVVSDTFLITWQRLGSVPSDHPREWLYAVALNVIRHHLRTTHRQHKLVNRMSMDLLTAGTDADGPSQVEDQLLVGAVLATLSARDQEVLRLSEWEQLTQPDVARVLGCTVTAVKVRLHRARRRFAGALDAERQPTPPTERSGQALTNERTRP